MAVVTNETLWTCVARCATCHKELNRAEHVPAAKKEMVALGAPMVALCSEPAHNTASDLNLRVSTEWLPEPIVQRVFQMNDCDWMAGESLEACKAEYLKNYWGGSTGREDEAFEDPSEIPAEAMDRMKFCDDDGSKRTFREELDRLVALGLEFPRFFASTEY